jgi:hypothetical protein
MWWVALFLVLMIGTAEAQGLPPCAAPTFAPGVPFNVGPRPRALVAADLNRDGSVDLVTGSASGALAIVLNNGDGTFAPPQGFPIGHGVLQIVSADFNRDGFPDLAGIASGAGVFVLIGTGNGGFAVGSTFELVNAVALATGDFNDDAHVDLAAVDNSLQQILVRIGDGSGGFGEPLVLPTGNRSTLAGLTAADFNQDGRLDLAVAGGSPMMLTPGTVEVRLGNGDGTFQNVSEFTIGGFPHALVAADVNRDGRLDLASPVTWIDNNGGDINRITLLIGDGSGAFGLPTVLPLEFRVTGDLDISDFNGDGNIDLVVSGDHVEEPFDSSIRRPLIGVLPGNGSGGFGEPQRHVMYGSGGGEAVVADFHGDGKLDLAGANNDEVGRTYVFRNMCGSVVDISAMLSVPKPLILERPAVYTISLENRGPDTAYALSVDIDINRPILQAWSLTASEGACQPITDARFTCVLGDIVAGETVIVSFTAKPDLIGVGVVMVQARSGGLDPTPDDHSASDSTLVQILGAEDVVLRAPDGGGAELTWTAGDAQSGYYVIRRVGATTEVFPGVGTPLPASATSFTDPSPVPGSLNCYVVVPVGSSGEFLGRSDMPCLQPLTASPSGAPSNPTLGEFFAGANRNSVRITWDTVDGATGYIVRIFAADGQKYWEGTAGTSARAVVFGASSCYVVFAMNGETPIGHSHTLCAVWGVGNIPR